MKPPNGLDQTRTSADRAPNRVLDLAELELPHFQRVIRPLRELVERESVSYLHPSKLWEYPWAVEQADLTGGETLLDAGCGASIFPVYLAREGFPTAAVDLNLPRGLNRMHGVFIGYAEGDLASLPFPDESFDAVFCISVIEHLPTDCMPAALGELRRVLRDGGKLLLTTDFYRDARARLRYEGPGGSFPVDWTFFDPETLREMLRSAPGLTVAGEIDLEVDWDAVSPAMQAFHGYPYTSVGIALVKG